MTISGIRHLASDISAERTRFPLWFPVGVGCGIGLYFAQSGPTPLAPYVLGLAAAVAFSLFAWQKAVLRLLALAAVALLLGASASAVRLHRVAAPVLREPVFFKQTEGAVEDIQHKEGKTKYMLRDVRVETLAAADMPEHVSITVKDKDVPEVHVGDRITLPATLFPPPGPAMPGAYDFARMFYFDGLGAVGFSPRQPILSPLEGGDKEGGALSDATNALHGNRPHPNPPTQGGGKMEEGITALRLRISDHLVAVMGPEAGAIASALMVGEQSRVPEEISESMRASGIYHILSISGLHMALATGMIFFVVRLLLAMVPHTALYWPNKKIAAVAGLVGGAAYLLLAGAPVPAIRSYIMVACVMVAVLADRKGISMFSLAWAATAILLLMPESLFTASFQLTFAATLAIVALYERFGHVFFHAHAGVPQRIFLYFLGLMFTSLAATFYTTPLAILHFNRLGVYGILANMLIVPLSSFWIMPWALIAFLAMPLGLDSWPLAMLKYGLEWMVAMSRFVAHFPYANIILPPPGAGGAALIVAGGLWLALWLSRWHWLGLGLILAGLSTIALFKPYDLIVSDDAKRIAYRSAAGQWVMLRGDVDSFESEIWLRMQGAETMLARKEALGAVAGLACDKTTCLVERAGKAVVVALRKDARGLCESGADVVVTSQFLSCDTIPRVIDRAFVEEHGATALRFTDGVLELFTTQASRGSWPWAQGTSHDE